MSEQTLNTGISNAADQYSKISNVSKTDFDQILAFKDMLRGSAAKLRTLDPNDNYWKEIEDLYQKAAAGNTLFLESSMVISWIGATRKPKKVLEIGTRTGGSLIALLRTYSPQELESISEIDSFDMWREYISTTPFSFILTKLTGAKRNVNISERYTKYISRIIEHYSTRKVKRNLAAFSIPSKKINFISGDSKQTVPEFFKQNPGKKFDYILVDGAHDEHTALVDLENIADKVEKNGIVVFDDIAPESYNLIGVWNTFKARHAAEFEFFEIFNRKGVAFAIRK
jgi:predicted O-methyltransferase YrrM